MSDQSCLTALLNLPSYLDGELSETAAAEVRRHFELCTPCSPALSYLRSLRDTLHRASEEQPRAPDRLRQRVTDVMRGAT